jgi:hypothetical protein
MHSVNSLLDRAVREMGDVRRFLLRERAGRNLPPALPFEERAVREAVERSASPSAFTGPQPALQQPHPDVVVPRCMPWHTPVWDALIWRFVRHVEPTGCSQQAHLLRNYPPYLVTHAEPLAPLPLPSPDPLSAATTAMSSLSLHRPAVAAGPVLPSIDMAAAPVTSDAPLGVDAEAGGAVGRPGQARHPGATYTSSSEDGGYGDDGDYLTDFSEEDLGDAGDAGEDFATGPVL